MTGLKDSAAALHLDTSVALRATLEQGTTPQVENRIAAAPVLVTSRLLLVESARALLWLRVQGKVSERRLADARRELDVLWSRCELWELSRGVCDLASLLAPDKLLRTLDALHLATSLMARARIEGLELLTGDKRLEDAANSSWRLLARVAGWSRFQSDPDCRPRVGVNLSGRTPDLPLGGAAVMT